MTKTALIIEDEKLTADRLIKLLADLTDVEVIDHLSSVNAAKSWFESNTLPDIIFLDIHLGDGTGFDILDFVVGFPFIIFTTAYDKYTLEAFQYNSVDYLLKPIKPKELIKAVQKVEKLSQAQAQMVSIDKLKATIEKKYKTRFLFKVGSKFQRMNVVDLAYFYSHDGLNYARSCEGETFISDHIMDELEQLLDPQDFFRCNRGMILRADNIKEIHSYFNGRLLLKLNPTFDHGEVLVSREKVKAFKQWLDE